MLHKKTAILLIHGFVGGNYDFGNLPNELSIIKNFDIFTFTLPGHDKVIVKDIKFEEWINEAKKQIEFLINHKYKKIYIIGHSMGGVIATYLASIYPQVKKLILVAPAFGYFSFKDGKIDIKDFNNTLKNLPEFFKEENFEKLLSRIIKTPIATMLEFTKLVSEYKNTIEKINCELLIIHGDKDKVVPKEAIDFAHNNSKTKTNILINVKNANHDCFNSKRKDDIIDIIKNFSTKKKLTNKKILDI